MTETEQQIALCEWAGWSKHFVSRTEMHYWKSPTGVSQGTLPNTNSLDVLAEFEGKLNADQEEDYVEELKGIMGRTIYEDDPRWLNSNLSSQDATYRAKPAQRREALLRSLGLWKD